MAVRATGQPRSIVSKQRLDQFVGISGANSGAKGLSLNRVVIPPGGNAAAHRHLGSESAIDLLQGGVPQQRLDQFVGISGANSGAKGLSLKPCGDPSGR